MNMNDFEQSDRSATRMRGCIRGRRRGACGPAALALALCAAIAGPLTAAPVKGPGTGLQAKRSPRPTVDAGDSYVTPKGPRRLLREAGAVAVRPAQRTNQSALIEALTRAGSPLESWVEDWQAGRGYTVLRQPARETVSRLRDPAAQRELLDAARRAPGLGTANPVFIDPESRLRLVPTEEIILCLRNGTDPQTYFGADWPRVRRLAGTRDKFVLSLAGTGAEDMLAEVNRRAADPRVAWAEPNFLGQVVKQSADPYYAYQWHLNNTGQSGGKANADINAPEAWQVTAGRRETVIAIIDDGTEIAHPDLSANIFTNPGEDGRDADGNGYVGDVHGWNFCDENGDPNPVDLYDDHGTATAGVAAAVGENLRGGAGVAFDCRIMPIKVIRGDFGVEFATFAEAVYYAAGSTRDGRGTWRGADVISLSLAFDYSQAVDDALSWAVRNGREGYGCPVFAAAGNNATRWQATRLRIPVGWVLGRGAYSFGFEYRKDRTESAGEDLIMIDNVALLRGDGVTVVPSNLGPGGRQDFEGSAFPPPGWESFVSPDFGGLRWSASTDRALTGTGGSRSARSGYIPNSSWTELDTPYVSLAGDEILTFSIYTSCEFYDGLYVYAYDADGYIVYTFDGPAGLPLAGDDPDVFTGVEYPARHPDVSGVGSSTDADRRADYSQFGTGLDFLAPSSGGWSDIVTTDRTGTNGYAYEDYQPTLSYAFDFGGTSAAAPLAAGVSALLISANPTLTAQEVRAVMQTSCAQIGGVSYVNGWNAQYGYGRLNAAKALKTALPNLALAVARVPDPVLAGTDLQFTVTLTNRGLASAVDVWVETDFPADLLLGAVSVPHDYQDGHLTLYLGDLTPGAGAAATVQATPQTIGRMTNTFYTSSAALDFAPADDVTNVVTRVRGPDILPPTVTITVPAENATVTNAASALVGTVTDDLSVSALEYHLENLAGTGSSQVISNPAGTRSFNWSGPLTGVFPGTNRVRARAWDGTGNLSPETTRTFFYALKSRLRVFVNGPGTITPNWTNQNVNLNKGFTLQAVPGAGALFSNWVGRLGVGGPVQFINTSTQLHFLMRSNLVLEANFVANPFLAGKGTYNGLFYTPSGVEHESSGAFTLVLRKSGGYSADLQLAGQRFGLSGQFALDARATNTFVRDSHDVSVEWTLNAAHEPTNNLFGRVVSGDPAWEAVLLGDRAPAYGTNASPYRGKYTLLVTGTGDASITNHPAGDGVGTAVVATNGIVSLAGTLADGTPFTQSAQVSADGLWPLYAPLYNGRGSLLGWVTFSTNPPLAPSFASPRVSWIKPAMTNGLYPEGFETETTLWGSRYAKAAPVLPLTHATLVFLGGNLDEPLTNAVTLTASNTVVNGGPWPLSMTITRSNGLFAGTLSFTNENRTLTFQGAMLQRQTNGAGFFLGTNQSGRVSFGP